MREELQFKLRDWLKHEDLFEYGVTPQFLSRFDAVVLLEPLAADDLLRIFLTGADAGLRQSAAYFKSQGIKLEITEPAARRIAEEAARQPRLGARALKEAFRRVIRPYEFDPKSAPVGGRSSCASTVRQVEQALVMGKTREPAGHLRHRLGRHGRGSPGRRSRAGSPPRAKARGKRTRLPPPPVVGYTVDGGTPESCLDRLELWTIIN